MNQLPDDRLAEAYAVDEVLQASEATVVYRGHARASGDPIVAKVLLLQGTGVSEVHRLRFWKAVSGLIKHAPPGSAPLKDAVWGGDFAVLIFVPISGTRLTQISGLTPAQGAHLLTRAGTALHTLHEAGVSHLNLAPDNIFVASSGRVFLTGLGWGFLRLPASGAGFVAHELRKALDLAEPQRCDIFSLAFLTSAFFDARVEFGEEEAQVSFPEEVRQQLMSVERLETTLSGCLHQDPFERPASVVPLVEALEAAVPPGSIEEEGTVRLGAEEEAGTGILELAPQPEELPVVGPPGAPTPPEGQRETPEAESPAAPELPASEPSLPQVAAPASTAVQGEPELSAPPPPVQGEGGLQTALGAKGAAPGSLPGAARPKLWLYLGAGALVLVVAALWVGFSLFSGQHPAPATPTPLPIAEKVTPSPTPVAQVSEAKKLLTEASHALAAGELERAQGLLTALSPETLGGEERALHQQLTASVQREEASQGLSALRTAWKAGDLSGVRKALRRIASAEMEERALSAEDSHLLSQAREVQRVVTRLNQEENLQRWEGVLLAAQELEKLFPGTREAAQAQERAAKALEQHAQDLERQGKLPEALTTLRQLQQYLPARRGFAEKIKRLGEAQERRQRFRHISDKAANLIKEGKTEQGIAVLEQLPPEQAASPETRGLRERLSQQLADLDSAPRP